MKREDIRKLLGGYATGTLTAVERQALFEAALDDQELFDALAKEEPLRELLEDPAARARLLAALDDGPLPSLVGQALSPANLLPRLERWLWGHAVGVAAVACFLTVGGYVAWQARDRLKPALMAEMERQSIEVRDSALPEKPGSLPRRVFNPGAITKKPAPAAMAVPGPPPVVAPPRPALANLPLPAAAAPLPPPPAPRSNRVAAIPGVQSFRGEPIEVTSALPLLMTQTAPGAPAPGTSPRDLPLPAAGRATAGVAGGVAGGATGGTAGSIMATPMAAVQPKGLSLLEAQKGARELYDPALAPLVLTSGGTGGFAGGGGRGGGGGGAARSRSQANAAPAASAARESFSMADAAARPAASLGVRYQVLRRDAGGAFEALAAASDLAWDDAIKLRFIPNNSGYLCVFGGAGIVLLQSRVERLAPVETQALRFVPAGPREIYVLFTREEQPPLALANADSFIMKVRQGDSGTLSEAAGMEGVYVVNPAPGAPTGVPFIITLNFK
jgi:hypothetical protein